MDRLSHYLNTLNKTASLVIELTNLDRVKKDKLRDNLVQTYLQNYYSRLALKLSTAERKKLLEILAENSEESVKMEKIHALLAKKTNLTEVYKVALDELEQTIKDLIHIMNQVVGGRAKKQINLQLESWLNEASVSPTA